MSYLNISKTFNFYSQNISDVLSLGNLIKLLKNLQNTINVQ